MCYMPNLRTRTCRIVQISNGHNGAIISHQAIEPKRLKTYLSAVYESLNDICLQNPAE